ncbi:MAG: LmeA family phospholipid-binding protein [Candidatus Riflebacteria bacterium]|nr:LmeA family phospholipid-binding protein [Candidatus Riflebacteria bacterium]
MSDNLNAKGKNLRRFLAAGLLLLLTTAVAALPTGPRQIAQFERETLRCAREVFKQPGQYVGNEYVVELNNQPIRETIIRRAKFSFAGFRQADLEKFKNGDFDFAGLQNATNIEVAAFIEAAAVNELVRREISRISAKRRIFADVAIEFAAGQVRVTGKIDMKKVPGNPFSFLPQEMSPFDVTLNVRTEGGQIMLDIIAGQMNSQPFTPELNRVFLDWLNPLWDFAALPYQAALDQLHITPSGVEFSGRLFW